jgi:HEAT repeat protein
MAESASREEHMTGLEALGNLGPGETPAAVEELFESEDAELRSSSVRALRDTFDARADALLASALREDPVDEVRLSAVELLVENGARGKREGAVSLLDESLRSDESEDVRKGALAGMNVLATEDAMRSVEWTAGNDGSEEIRAMATAILEQWQQTREQPEAGF